LVSANIIVKGDGRDRRYSPNMSQIRC